MLLEIVYEALESAGYPLESVHGSQISVYVGVVNSDFNNIQQRDTETLPTYNATGTAVSVLSNRVSYFFDLKGPSVTVDTACSSSLVALHQAVQGLRTGGATAAIVASANLILDPYIVMDGVSWHIFLQDLGMAYRGQQLPLSAKQYVDFAQTQYLAAESDDFKNQLQFWQEQHDPSLAVIPLLPIARTTTRSTMDTYESHVVSYEVGPELVFQVKQASKSLRATPFHIHLAIIQSMLSRLLNVDEICIGVADANRTNEDYSRTVGFFLNLLPVRFQIEKGCNFQEVVQRTRQKMFAALSNSQVPFDLLLDGLKVPCTANHSPLFQVAVSYRIGAMLQIPLGDSMMEIASADDAKNPYDISFGITDTAAGTCLLELTAQTRLYSRQATKHLLEIYVNLLQSLSTNPSVLVETLPVEFSARSGEDIVLGKGPRAESAWPDTLSERFDDIQRRFPWDVAVKDETSVLTYSQLAGKVNSIGVMLRDHGLNVGDKVAILCFPSADAIICMLATLRLGCVYVPLDTRLPIGRHVAMIENHEPALILCHSDTHDTALELQAALTPKRSMSLVFNPLQ